jgi:nucleoid-associated protein YgaU
MILSAPLKTFLGVAGAAVVVTTVAYVNGAFDRFIAAPPAQVAALPNPAAPDAKADRPAQPEPKPAAPAATEAKPADPAAAPTTPVPVPAPVTDPAKAEIVPPAFDILRVEPDGSIVIAGKAPSGSKVEILTGSKVVGETTAGPEGDFAVVIDDPLKPGTHQIVLRATDEAAVVAMSPETAVVSIPEQKDGQVLALVEQPGQPSKLITVPEPMVATPPAPEAKPAAETAAAPEAAKPAAPAATAAAPVEAKPADPAPSETKPAEVAAIDPKPAASDQPPSDLRVEVKAIEIEGNKVFVAGVATPGGNIRAYANEILLGDAKASEGGEFLVETLRDLPVGDYIVRADLLAKDGNKVLMRAQVPFRREAGAAVAAVAAPTPAPAPAVAPAPAAAPAQSAPASVATAPAAPAQPAASAAETAVAAAPAQQPADKPADTAPTTVIPTPEVTLPAAPPSVTSAALQPVDGAVIIRRGDTLWQISRRVYGRGVRYSTIYLANQKQISDPDRIWPGQVFSVPVKTGEGESADMEAVADQKADPADVGTAIR